MKKVILLLSLVIALGASEYMCKDSYNRYEKYYSLTKMASERGDIRKIKFTVERQIYYLEDVISGCEEFYDVSSLNRIRLINIQFLKDINAL